MQVEFVGAPINNLENKINSLLNQSDKVSIAVAFLEYSGLSIIKQSMQEFGKLNNAKSTITIITSLDFGITDPEALQELLNLGICCGIIHSENLGL